MTDKDKDQMNLYGSPFALKRYHNYDGGVKWVYHSDYFGHQIYRAHHMDGRPAALYRCLIPNQGVIVVGDGLYQCKTAVKEYLKGAA